MIQFVLVLPTYVKLNRKLTFLSIDGIDKISRSCPWNSDPNCTQNSASGWVIRGEGGEGVVGGQGEGRFRGWMKGTGMGLGEGGLDSRVSGVKGV